MIKVAGSSLIEWKIRGNEPTIFPEPVRSILFIFSTPASRLNWRLSDGNFPLLTTRILGVPQPDIKALRPLYLRMFRNNWQFIITVEYSVLDSQGNLSVAESNVVKYSKPYEKMIEMIIESQAGSDWGWTLLLIEMITGGATSLAHDKVFNSLKERIEKDLYNRRSIPIKLVQIPVYELRSLVRDEMDRRIRAYEEILKSDSIKLVIIWPSLYSHKEKKNIVEKVDAVVVKEVANHVNTLVLFHEEIAAYRMSEMSRHRQLTDLKRYGNIFIPTKVMNLRELEECLKRGDIITFTDQDIPLDMSRAILLVHGFAGNVEQAERLFIDYTGTDKIVSATRQDVHGLKSVLLIPINENAVQEILKKIKNM